MSKSIKRLALLIAALAAIIPAAAYARPVPADPQPYTVTLSSLPPVMPAVAHDATASSAQSFSWHDAGFGAAGMLVLIAVGAGAAVAVRRRTLPG